MNKLKEYIAEASKKSYSWRVLASIAVFLLFILIVVYLYSEMNSRSERIHDLERKVDQLRESYITDKSLYLEDDLDANEGNEGTEKVDGEGNSQSKELVRMDIEYYNELEEVYEISLFEDLKQNMGDPDNGVRYYKVGKVIGLNNVNYANSIGIEEGFEYYVAVYIEDQPVDNLVPSYIRFVKSKDPEQELIYIVDKGYSISGLPITEGYVFDKTDQVDNSIFYLSVNYEYKTKNDYQIAYKSDDDNIYEFVYFKGVPFNALKTSSLIKVDSIGKSDVFIDTDSSDGSSYMRSVDGFTYVLRYVPEIVKSSAFDSDPVPEIVWEDGSQNDGVYDYISLGGCFDNQLEIADVSEEELRVVGEDSVGNNIYEMKNSNDDYRTKVYEEYKEFEMNVGNSVAEDDEEFLTYNEYLSFHPVFFWKDPFGRFLKFGSRDFIITGGCAKPAIYMYPKETSDIKVKVIPNGVLTYTLPRYEEGWNVSVDPSGRIVNKNDAKEYDYLWWESRSNGADIPKRGYVIQKTDLTSFFDEKLSQFGLNGKERDDFKDYWIKRMNKEGEQFFFITFLYNEQVDQIAKLRFSKEPDSLMRIFMIYKPMNEYSQVEPLVLPKNKREGFSVVEWGGAKSD